MYIFYIDKSIKSNLNLIMEESQTYEICEKVFNKQNTLWKVCQMWILWKRIILLNLNGNLKKTHLFFIFLFSKLDKHFWAKSFLSEELTIFPKMGEIFGTKTTEINFQTYVEAVISHVNQLHFVVFSSSFILAHHHF